MSPGETLIVVLMCAGLILVALFGLIAERPRHDDASHRRLMNEIRRQEHTR